MVLYLTIEIGTYLCRQELEPANYLSVIVDKHLSLTQATTPKVVFIGDSSLAFGLDGEKVEEEIGRPVVNMGLHAAFGLPFVFSEVAPDLKSGDTVVAIFHYYPTKSDVNEGVVCHALDFYPAMYDRLDLNIFLKNKLEFTCKVKKIRRYILNKTFKSSNTDNTLVDETVFDYKRWAFNRYGDIRSELYVTSTIDFRNNVPYEFDTDQRQTLDTINYYNGVFNAKGVRLLLVYPPYPMGVFKDNFKAVNEFDELLRSKTSVAILNNPADAVLPDEYFFNSDYHLTSVGKSVYTDKVIGLIETNYKQ